jgi:hypothetical protein
MSLCGNKGTTVLKWQANNWLPIALGWIIILREIALYITTINISKYMETSLNFRPWPTHDKHGEDIPWG